MCWHECAGIFGVTARRTVQEFSGFYALDSGGNLVPGAMYAIQEQSERSSQDTARLAIEAAAGLDDSTGLPFTSYEIKLRRG